MVETKGLIGSVEAADAMVKAANVVLVGEGIHRRRLRHRARARRCRRREGGHRRRRRGGAARRRARLGPRDSAAARGSRENPSESRSGAVSHGVSGPSGSVSGPVCTTRRHARVPSCDSVSACHGPASAARTHGRRRRSAADRQGPRVHRRGARARAGRAPGAAPARRAHPGTDRRHRHRHGRGGHARTPKRWRGSPSKRPATASSPTRSRRTCSARARCTSSSGRCGPSASSTGSRRRRSSRSPSRSAWSRPSSRPPTRRPRRSTRC